MGKKSMAVTPKGRNVSNYPIIRGSDPSNTLQVKAICQKKKKLGMKA